VRAQPRHQPVAASIWQTLTQGEATAGFTLEPRR
jgi:hypothetical protein